MYKIGSQEGYYIWVPSTYTTFSESTAYVIPFKSGYTAPESRGWYTECEPNNSTVFSNLRDEARWNSGVIGSSTDEDYYRMDLYSTKSIRFISPDGCDYDVMIYNGLGNLVARLISGNSEEVINYTFPETGYYYFKVYSYSGSSSTNPYYLLVE